MISSVIVKTIITGAYCFPSLFFFFKLILQWCELQNAGYAKLEKEGFIYCMRTETGLYWNSNYFIDKVSLANFIQFLAPETEAFCHFLTHFDTLRGKKLMFLSGFSSQKWICWSFLPLCRFLSKMFNLLLNSSTILEGRVKRGLISHRSKMYPFIRPIYCISISFNVGSARCF